MSTARTLARITLGGLMVGAGVLHLTAAREEFQAQVPPWFPADADIVVVGSGVVEIALGASLLALPRQRRLTGLALAAFYVAVFPGNIAQWLHERDGFGLDTDAKRFGRLFFQPVLIALSLWCTNALRPRRRGR